MTKIFETKVASADDIDQRLATLSQAERAFLDYWGPRFKALEARRARALGRVEEEPSKSARKLQRAVIEAQYGAMHDELLREGKIQRKALDRLFDFYLDEGLDPEERTLH
jgi:hypothetical protein